MIHLYTFTTPNGRKASVMLEETGLPYQTHVVHLGKGEQKRPEYLAINPNNKIPAIVDTEGPGGGLTLWESGAILIYLAEKTGQFLSRSPHERYQTLQWLMFQMGGVGPMFGQLNHFALQAKEKIPYAIDRFTEESKRLLNVLEGQLSKGQYLVSDYSIADIAMYTWVDAQLHYFPDLVSPFAKVSEWHQRIGQRPAVQRGMKVPELPKEPSAKK